MFTGIIEHVGRLVRLERVPQGARLCVEVGPLFEGLRLGDSVAVDGMCLTATDLDGGLLHADVSSETLEKTTVGGWQANRRVNLERALKVGDRLGGHLVSGHVDGVGRLLSKTPVGNAWEFTFLRPKTVRVVAKGSIAIDGVSLTVAKCRGQRLSVAVIPHTFGGTTLAEKRPGDPVNLEEDPIGKWVAALMGR
jgi:riboflavin synthase